MYRKVFQFKTNAIYDTLGYQDTVNQSYSSGNDDRKGSTVETNNTDKGTSELVADNPILLEYHLEVENYMLNWFLNQKTFGLVGTDELGASALDMYRKNGGYHVHTTAWQQINNKYLMQLEF